MVAAKSWASVLTIVTKITRHPHCVQVSVKRGLSFLRCTSGQASTAGMPCEDGVVAYDEVDGASIQDRVSASRAASRSQDRAGE